MRKRHESPTTLALSGVRILVGRARHQAGSLSHELRKLGADVLEIPFIEIRKPRSFKPLDLALKNVGNYDWLILTSVNGVEALWERLAKLRLTKRNLKHLRVVAIGPATKKAIEQRGIEVDVVPKEYVAESVVRSLQRRVKGKRVLLVRAKVARDVNCAPRVSQTLARRVEKSCTPSPCGYVHQFVYRAQLRRFARLTCNSTTAPNISRAGVPAPHRSGRNTSRFYRSDYLRHTS